MAYTGDQLRVIGEQTRLTEIFDDRIKGDGPTTDETWAAATAAAKLVVPKIMAGQAEISAREVINGQKSIL